MTVSVAVVTGGNRGLGRGTAQALAEAGYRVVLTARDLDKAQAAASAIASEVGSTEKVVAQRLDVTNPDDARELARFVEEQFGRLDTVVNNAGVFMDDRAASAFDAEVDVLRQTFEINTIGAWTVSRALAPLLKQGGGGNLVQLSSGLGALADMGGGLPGYRMSKTALNALTRILHAELHSDGVRVNAVCPGWVRTDMGGSQADRALNEGVAGIVWAATLEAGGPSGGFFRDGKAIDW